MQTLVYVAFGSNLGNREDNIRAALSLASERVGNCLTVSSLYLTAPEAMDDVPDFVNAVACFKTSLSARELLRVLQGIEGSLGRPADHGVRESRTIDLDIVSFGDCRIDEPGLVVPHPRAHLRGFVLEPLAEIAPALVLPGQSKTARELANGIAPRARMKIISPGKHDG